MVTFIVVVVIASAVVFVVAGAYILARFGEEIGKWL